jgi:hypothetical protein
MVGVIRPFSFKDLYGLVKRNNYMEDILQIWTLKTIQEYLNICQHLKDNGRSEEDVKEYVKQLGESAKRHKTTIAEERERNFIAKPIRKCPICGGVLKLFSLNRKEFEANPRMYSKWECCKTCKTESCGYVEYNKQSVEQILNIEEE